MVIYGDRRHHRRHRGPALHRGHRASSRKEAGREQRAVRPRDARAVYRRGPARSRPSPPSAPCKELREPGRLARHHRAPRRSRDRSRRHAATRCAPFCDVDPDDVLENRTTARSIYDVPHPAARAGLRRLRSADGWASTPPRGRTWPNGAPSSTRKRPPRPQASVDIARGGQVRRACRTPTSRSSRRSRHAGIAGGAPRERAPDRRRGARPTRTLRTSLGADATASSCRAALARAASRARSPPPATPARHNVPFLGICLGHAGGRAASSRATSCGLDGAALRRVRHAAPDATPFVIDLMPDAGATSTTRAAPCAWAPIPASCRPGTLRGAAYGEAASSTSGTATAIEVNNAYRAALEAGRVS